MSAPVACDAVLSTGAVARIRPPVPADRTALEELNARTSDRSIYLRYFSLDRAAADQYVTGLVEPAPNHGALVAEVDGVIVGVASFERLEPATDAEIAFQVDDDHQRMGVGTLLLEHLIATARRSGVRRFVADTLVDNTLMTQVFRDAGYQVSHDTDYDVVHVAFDIDATEPALAAADARERHADAASLAPVLAPRSVAVVGASERPGSIGGALLRTVVDGGFTGPVYPVHPSASHVAGLTAYPTVAAIPERVDLAIVAVPAAAVPGVLADCGARGVRGAVVVSSGFRETGGEGPALERAILATARRHGIRLIGPNCLGIVNTDPGVRLDATFARTRPVPGPVGFASQSGALGIALMAETAQRGLGLSMFVSLGNKADVSGNDLLLYWENDPNTEVIALYLESFGNPRKFLRHARRIAVRKPIVVLKAGRGTAGQRAGASHTAAAATPDAVVDTLLEQAGVIRAQTTCELLDVLKLLSSQPLPAGSRLGIISNAGGPAILAADAAESVGLTVPMFSEHVQHAVARAATAAAGLANPVDLGAGAGPVEFDRVLDVVLTSGQVDAVLVIHAVTGTTDPAQVAAAISHASERAAGIPVTACQLGAGHVTAMSVPAYAFPEDAVRALGHAAAHNRWRATATTEPAALPSADPATARCIIDKALSTTPDGCWLDPTVTAALLDSYGIAHPPQWLVHTAAEAVTAAAESGYPVVLKTAAPGVVHKTERGGIHLDLRTADAVRAAFATIAAGPGLPVLVQPMAGAGIELIVGMARQDAFGPVLMLGMGGTAADILGDRVLRLPPLSERDPKDMIRRLRGAPLLKGYRGSPPVDLGAIEDVLLRVARLADDMGEITELDLNPVLATPSGVLALDAKIRLAPPNDEPDPLLRRLR